MLRTTILAIALAGSVPAVAQQPVNLFAGWWNVEDTTSPVTGKRSVLISTSSHKLETPTSGTLLAIRCAPGRRHNDDLSVFVVLARNMSATRGCVAYKADTDAPQEDCHGHIGDDDRVYALGDPAAFVKSLVGKRKVLLEIPVHTRAPIVAEFTVTGLEQHLAAIKPMCIL